jgi:NCAIR mutase (PurE)-related protein
VTEFRLDHDRAARTGIPEAVLCEHKSAAQIAAIGAARM